MGYVNVDVVADTKLLAVISLDVVHTSQYSINYMLYQTDARRVFWPSSIIILNFANAVCALKRCN